MDELGRRAFGLALALIEGQPADSIRLPSRLIVRHSAAAPSA